MKAETLPISIRRACEGDAAVLHLFAEALSAEEGRHARFRLELPTLRQWLMEERFIALLAERGGEPAGMALAHPGYDLESGSTGLHLGDLYVAPLFRRQGIARSLVRALGDCMPGGEWLSWTVLKKNDTARDFYRMLGARKVAVDFMAIGTGGLRDIAKA